jgi:hypothetical protein
MANLHKGTPINEVPQVMRADMIKIDPKSKYLLHINWGPVPQQHRGSLIREFEERLAEWYQSDKPVFTIFTYGQPLKIYKLDNEEQESS